MNIVVTGGAGFIGSHVAEALAQDGEAVTIFDIVPEREAWRITRDLGSHYRCADVRDLKAVRAALESCDAVIHLAGLLGTDSLVWSPRDAVETNIGGMLNVLDAAGEAGVRIVNISLIPDWNNSYMITKQAASKFCLMYAREFGAQTVDLRLSHIYGPRQLWGPIRKAVPSFIRAALATEPIAVFGNGQQLMDLLYVSDVVCAIRKALIEPKAVGRSMEIGYGRSLTLHELVHTILELTNSRSEIHYVGRRPGEPEDFSSFREVDVQQQQDVLDFHPKTPLRAGLMRTIDAIERYLAATTHHV